MRIDHEYFIRLAMEEAKKGEGRTSPYPFVGCVVVRSGRVIGSGHTQSKGKEHAEVNTLKALGKRAKGSTLYSTLEPCHHNDYQECDPCSQWIKRSGVRTVVWGARDPNTKNKKGSTHWLSLQNVQVIGRVLEKECQKLHEVFLVSLAHRRPFVFLSTAMSLDGKITWRKNESPIRFSGPPALNAVHRLRHCVDALCVGARTVAIDNPRLTVRIPGGRNPHRIVMDSHCQISPHARIFDVQEGSVIVFTTAYSPIVRRQALVERGAEVIVIAEDPHNNVDLKAAMKELYRRSITSLMIEGGGELIASALKARIVDKIYFWYSPLLIGGADTPTAMEGEPLERFGDAIRLKDLSIEKVGEDVLVSGYVT